MGILLQRLGFVPVSTWLFGSDALEVFTAVGSALGWSSGFTRSADAFALESLQASVDAAGLSDVMLVVAKRSA